jgi:hypothetical protein
MSDEQTPWIMEGLDRAAKEWEDRPEWTKPVVNSPYFAARSDFPRPQPASTRDPVSDR